MYKIKSLSPNSVWYADRDNFIGETFTISGSRYTPQSDKAKQFAAAQNIKFFVFMGTAVAEEVKATKKQKA